MCFPDAAIVTHLSGEVAQICGKDLLLSEENVEELAHAVARFLRDQKREDYVESNYLVMLASRALSSVGEGAAARRLLLFGTGLIRPAEWEVTAGREMWVLDLKKMTVRDDAPLELLFFNSLNVVLESIADIWDESSGKGALGLRHVHAAVSSLAGRTSVDERTSLAREIKAVCDGKLEQVGTEREWSGVPEVLILDL